MAPDQSKVLLRSEMKDECGSSVAGRDEAVPRADLLNYGLPFSDEAIYGWIE